MYLINAHSISTRFILDYNTTLFVIDTILHSIILIKRYHHLSVAKIPPLLHKSNTFTVFFHNNLRNTFSTTLLTILGEFPEYSGHSGPYTD